MGQSKLEGSLIGGPPAVSELSFPNSQFIIGLSYADGCAKQWLVATGVLTRQLSSGSFVVLSGVGPGDTVTQGTSLYFKCNVAMQLEVTFHPPSGPDIVSVIPVRGPLVLETPDDSYYIVGLRCLGSGPIEYLVAGPA